MKPILEAFRAPDAEFSPFPFWFLNGDLNDGELERQLNDFLSKDIHAVVLHPRVGVPESLRYLSDAFLDRMETIVSFAAAHDMRVLLYDEGMYPSGSAHGMVVKENPAYAARGLCLRTPGDALEPGDHVLARIALVRHADGYVPGSVRVLQKTEEPTAGEAEYWLVAGFTRGTIRGIHENEDDGQANAPAAADLLNAEAMQVFIRLTHQRYYERLKPYFGKTILGFFTDEPSPTGRAGRRGMCPWTEGFETELAEKGFPVTDLPALFLPCGGEERRIRARFGRLVDERMTRTYYQPISDWCVSHGIALCGHPHGPQNIKLLESFGIPGQDIVWRWVAPENDLALGSAESAQAKCASDAARHIGAPRNLNECFGCCGPNGEMWAFNVDEMRWYLNWLFARGCNLIIPHAFYYELARPVQMDRPPDAGPNNIWWPHYRQIAGFIARACALNADGVNQARVAVLGTGDSLPVEKVRALYERQIEFNYLTDEQLLKLGHGENGALTVAKQRYEAVLLDDALDYDAAALAMLRAYAGQGLKVIHSARALSDEWRTVRLSGRASGIRASHVKRGDEALVLLANELGEAYSGTVTLPFTGMVAVLDPWTGEAWRENAEDGRLKLRLERRQLLYVCRCMDAEALAPKAPERRIRETKPLDARWQMTLPDGSVVPGVGDWQEIEALRVFSGTCTARCTVTLRRLPAQAELCLGDVREMAEVRVNGQDAGALLAPPYRVDVTHLLRVGENQLEVDITNSLVSHYEHKPWPSGLLGGTKLILREE